MRQTVQREENPTEDSKLPVVLNGATVKVVFGFKKTEPQLNVSAWGCVQWLCINSDSAKEFICKFKVSSLFLGISEQYNVPHDFDSFIILRG